MARTYAEQLAARKKAIRTKGTRPNMTYRVFRWNNISQTYRLIPGKEDVTIPGVGIRWTQAALKWAEKWAQPEENEIHLMIARFSTRIEEVKLITLTRQPNPWGVKPEPDDCDCGDDEEVF